MLVYLIRHGQTAWNVAARAQGHSNIPLDEVGAEQARLLGLAFSGKRVDSVISSDLSRSAETARPVAEALGLPLVLDVRLRERSFGDWEGLEFDHLNELKEADRLARKIAIEEVVPPNGESVQMVWDRLSPVASEVIASSQTIVVVTHGGTCALLLSQFLGGSFHTARSFRFANTAVTELERRTSGPFLLNRYNDVAHLNGALALAGGLGGARQ